MLSRLSTVLNIALPLLVGLLLGVAAEVSAFMGARVLSLNFSHTQNVLTVVCFVMLGCAFGLVDTAFRLKEWWKTEQGHH